MDLDQRVSRIEAFLEKLIAAAKKDPIGRVILRKLDLE